MITPEGNIRVSDANVYAMAEKEVTPEEGKAAEAELKELVRKHCGSASSPGPADESQVKH